MVFGNIRDIENFSWLEENVINAFYYTQSKDLLSLEKGSYEIDENMFVNIVEYETTLPENRFWEAHREYLDLHLMLSGTERVDVNFIRNMDQQEYVEKDDFLPLTGEPNSSVILSPYDFLLLYPSDAHRTAVAVKEPIAIKKAIFKIKIC